MSREVPGATGDDARLTALRNAIRGAFPDVVYTGKVTPHDGEWPTGLLNEQDGIYGDEKLLYEALYGRKWSDLPREFLHGMCTDYVLLTNEAWVAFLAAWLMCSLEGIGFLNDVGQFLIYALGPSDEAWMTDSAVNRLRALNSEQRAVVRSVLAEFAQRDRYVRREASEAVKLIDSLT